MSHNQIDLLRFFGYTGGVKFLTKQEQWVLAIVLGLLLIGWCVKWYRTAHPPETAAVQNTK